MRVGGIAAVAVWMIAAMPPGARAASRSELVFGQEYACPNGSRFVVRSCSIQYNAEFCKLDSINEATPGRFVSTEMRRDLIENSVGNCTVAGVPVQAAAGPTGQAGQALYGASWRDVTILERRGDLVHVRWAAGGENWWPADRVRAVQAYQDVVGGVMPEGRYECWGAGGHPVGTLNFDVVGPGRYRAAGSGETGSFEVEAGGRVVFAGIIGQSVPPEFRAVYHVEQGRPKVSFIGSGGAEAEWCERQ